MKQQDKKNWIPPKHWVGVEQLTPEYEQTQNAKAGQEFYEKPIEWLEGLGQAEAGIRRREFLTVMGASLAMTGLSCARRPVHKIIPYVIQPEEITPGVPNWYASTCQECEAHCGLLVKTREGRPIKLEGNPKHPSNLGSLCARGQASVLGLYDPDRLKAPRVRKDQQFVETSWDKVDRSLRSVCQKTSRIRIVTGEMKSPSLKRAIEEFSKEFPQARHIEYDPLHLEEIAQAQALAYGRRSIPHYRFEQADYVLSLGADFLGQWIAPVEYARTWSQGRKLSGQTSKMSRLVVFEPTMTLTGASADQRYPVRPGDELGIALALAYELVVVQKRSFFAQDPQIVAFLTQTVTREIPQKFPDLKKVAEELWAHRAQGLVVAGGLASRTPNAVYLQVVVNFLNSVLGNEGVTVDGVRKMQESHSSWANLWQLFQEMQAGQVDVLIVHQLNLAYYFPPQKNERTVAESFQKVPCVIFVGDQENETTQLAHYSLPEHHALESWGDALSRHAVSVQQPTLAPLYQTRGLGELLLGWMGRKTDWHAYVKAYWQETYDSKKAPFDQFWEEVLRTGFIELPQSTNLSARSFDKTALLQVRWVPESSELFSLSLYATGAMGEGRYANHPWLQELPDPISSVTWDNYLNVSPFLAKKLGLEEHHVVELTSGEHRVELPVHIQPGLHPEAVSVAIGYGRRVAGRVGTHVGVDVFPLAQRSKNQWITAGQKVSLKATGQIYRLAETQWHFVSESRPIVNDISFEEFKKNPAATGELDPPLRMDPVPTLWPQQKFDTYRWGMAIDLNACTGCGACVIACQAENNIPVVGRQQVLVSRQMHWIRIDRYYSGSPENPKVVFQPMLCQHCENASCETVCPVLATVHDQEGLNVQVYNRCVGTRYCQNNCPYKVRRFNFFDHWKTQADSSKLVWNPDVTVRTRGIMEKCSFCDQRIRVAKDRAKDLDQRIQDGDFQVACQQTCPTQAIVFGNVNDPKSRVAQMKKSPQAFRVLEALNNKPMISYMTKVRNT